METYPDKFKALEDYVDAHKLYEYRRSQIILDGGAIIRLLRNLSKISLRKFAARYEVSPSYLSKVERGLEIISPELAGRILNDMRPDP